MFNFIYKNNIWGDVSLSGFSSSKNVVSNLIVNLNMIIKKYKISRILDVSCGYFDWMESVDLDGVEYIGVDASDYIIGKNINDHGSESRFFLHKNMIFDLLPMVDLVVCKDVLEGLPDDDVLLSIENIKKTKSSYLLISDSPFCLENESRFDLSAYKTRKLNLSISPFFFPKPMESFPFSENSGTWLDDRHMNLYDLKSIEV
jgi:hypothetical protein